MSAISKINFFTNVAGGLPQGATTYNPGPLELARTYYWRIDEANDTNAGSPWTGSNLRLCS